MNTLETILNSWPFIVIKIVITIYCLVLIFNIVYLVRSLSLFKRRARQLLTGTQAKPESYKSLSEMSGSTQILEINKKVNSESPSDWKIAIIEGDKLFDNALLKKGFSGGSVGEKLKQLVPADLPDLYEEVWEAHKIRNRIVHEPDFEVTQSDARKIVNIFDRAIKKII